MKNEMIFKTHDYNRFKMHDAQPRHRVHNNKLESEMLKSGGNLVPAQVARDNTIIEGHGRFAICKKNGLPFRYTIIEENKDTIAILNTTSASWRIIDYIESYGNSNHSYNMLYNILSSRKVPFSLVANFINMNTAKIKRKDTLDVNFTELIEFINLFRKIVELTGITETRSVARAITKFMRLKEFEDTRLISSVTNHWTRMNPIKIGGEEFILKRLSEVYDYRSRDKKDLETLTKQKKDA